MDIAGPAAGASSALASVHAAREVALRACRAAIQASGRSIRAVHRGSLDTASSEAAAARASLDEAQSALSSYPAIGTFLHDAEKEYAEAVLCSALISGSSLPSFDELRVGPAAWLNGLAEAGSELRRKTLDTLRAGDLPGAEGLLATMDGVYEVLVTVDYPDAVTGGLRRTTDAFRAVLERTRSDLTTTVLQGRLQALIEESLGRRPE